MIHAAQKLEALGDRLPYPHSSAVKGEEGAGFRELRPRGGRSRWRPIYRRVEDEYVIFAVGPEAEIDQAGFDRAVSDARGRFDAMDEA